MDPREAVDIVNKTFYITLVVLTPVLGAGLIVGLSIAIFQSITQIQEMTLTFIPKMLAMALVLMYTFPWVMNVVMDFTNEVFALIVLP